MGSVNEEPKPSSPENNLRSPHTETMRKRATRPQIMRFLPSVTAFSSPLTFIINLARPQKKASKAKPAITGMSSAMRSRKILIKSAKVLLTDRAIYFI